MAVGRVKLKLVAIWRRTPDTALASELAKKGQEFAIMTSNPTDGGRTGASKAWLRQCFSILAARVNLPFVLWFCWRYHSLRPFGLVASQPLTAALGTRRLPSLRLLSRAKGITLVKDAPGDSILPWILVDRHPSNEG